MRENRPELTVRIKEEHKWDVSVGEAKEIQRSLSRKVRIVDGFKEIRLVGGADVSFSRDRGCAACVVMSFPGLDTVEEVMAEGRINFPYVPGLLTFREGPLLLKALLKLETEPDVIVFDGQGIAHPQGLGLAAHMGVLLGRPTVGCAKSRLVGTYREPGPERGSFTPLVFEGRRVGSVVRTRTNVKPVFVSPGNLIGLESSVELVLDCAKGYRLPEPTRVADRSCGRRTLGESRNGKMRTH
jgi:deoxyribonuclease V